MLARRSTPSSPTGSRSCSGAGRQSRTASTRCAARSKRVIRTESDDGDWFVALLKDGTWVHFHTMNDVLRRFIFDSKHCQHSGVTFSGQTEYTR